MEMEEYGSSSDKVGIARLDGNNYPSWKFKMRLLLIQKGLWNSVEGNDRDVSNAAKALATIGLSVDDSQIVHIQSCTSGAEAWMKYATLYENKGVANRIDLLNQLMTARMGEDDKAQEHIEKLRRVVGQLGTIDAPVDDQQYKLALLRSLPRKYETLVVTLENLLDTLTIEDIHARIMREEVRQGNNGEDDNGTPVDHRMLALRGIVCHYCRKKGHKKFQCFAYEKKQAADRSRRNNTSTRNNGGRSNDHAFSTKFDQRINSVSWYIDSFHATGNKDLFVAGSLMNVEERKIQVADGSYICANEEGTVTGQFKSPHGTFDVTLRKVLYVPQMDVNLISVGCIEQ